jgi:hypothetical protein
MPSWPVDTAAAEPMARRTVDVRHETEPFFLEKKSTTHGIPAVKLRSVWELRDTMSRESWGQTRMLAGVSSVRDCTA